MKNSHSTGNLIAVTAPATVASGAGVLIGSLFGIAMNAAASGEEVVIKTDGAVDMAKTAAQAWAVGQLIYWSGTAATTVVGTNKLIGVCVRDELAAAGIGRVRLNAAFVTP